MVEYRYSAEEIGMESVVRVLWRCGFVKVLSAMKDNDGFYYYWFFDGKCDLNTRNDKNRFLHFLRCNANCGYSDGAYENISALNVQILHDGLSKFGFFHMI